MESAIVLNNLETLNQTVGRAAGTQIKLGKQKSTKQQSKADNIKCNDFSAYMASCIEVNVVKTNILQQAGFVSGCVEQLDNSMHSNSPKAEVTSRIVGTLEGFGLLDFQTDPNGLVLSKSLDESQINALVQEFTNQIGSDIPSVLTNGLVKNSTSEGDLSGQFAGMQPQSPIQSLQGLTQEEILQRVGEYLCSLKSTNTKQSDVMVKNQEELQGSIRLQKDSSDSSESLVTRAKGTGTNAALNVLKPIETESLGKNLYGTKQDNADSSANVFADSTAENITTVQRLGTKESVKEVKNKPVLDKENIIRIVDRINTRSAKGRHEFEIQLKPEFLGKLNIKLSMENNSVKVLVNTTDEVVKAMVADQLPTLQSMLKDKGVQVSQMEVFCESETYAHQDGQTFGQSSSYQDGHTFGNQSHGDGRNQVKHGEAADAIISDVEYDNLMNIPRVNLTTSSVEFCA